MDAALRARHAAPAHVDSAVWSAAGRARPPEGASRRRAGRAQRRAAADGPPGIGKTELLRYAVEEAEVQAAARARDGVRVRHPVRRARGAGHAAVGPPRRDPRGPGDGAARRARARPRRGRRPLHGPRGAALAARRAADEKPVLAIVDDAQWLDEPSLEAFLFAGRRLGQEGVAMSARSATTRPRSRFRGSIGCGRAAARRRGAGAAGRRGRAGRRRPLIATAAGNPLALLEIPGLLSPASSPAASRWRTRCGPARMWSVRSRPRSTRCPPRPARAAARRRGQHAPARRDLLVVAASSCRRDLEPAEAARIVVLGRRRARVPPPAAALDRLPLRVAAGAPGGARGARRRRPTAPSAPGISPRAPSRPTSRSPRRSSAPRWRPAAAAPTPPPRATSAAPRSSRPRPSRGRAGCSRPPRTRSAAARPSAPAGCSTRPPG